MANSEARRQKQLAKKKAKRDEKRTHIARQTSDDPIVHLAAAGSWPIVNALVPQSLWDGGMGSMVLARRCPDGRLAVAGFLVDAYCLGVKDAYWAIMSESDYRAHQKKMERLGPCREVTPEHFAKLVFGAVDFAQSFGFPPHADYRHARLLLAGIDPSSCSETFEYGKDGRPYYIAGPHDSPEKIKITMHRVQVAGGHYTVPLDALEGGASVDDMEKKEMDYDGPEARIRAEPLQ